MSFAKASTKAEDVKQSGGNHITGSGMYPVKILAPVVSVSKGGSESVDLYVEHNGQKQIIYGNLRTSNNDGTPNKIGAKVFNQLMIIANLDEVDDPVEVELPIGKKEKAKTVAILEDLCDVECWMRVQMEYGKFNKGYTEKKVIKAFFRLDDKASAEEIVNESDVGAGYEREMKYVNNITFKDGVTQEQISIWIAASRPEGTAGGAGAPSADGPKKKPKFGKKRFANKDKATDDDDGGEEEETE